MIKKMAYHTTGLKIAAVVLIVLSAGAWSRADSAEQKFACREEIAQYCQGVKPGGGRILSCLKEHENDLSPACREKLAAVENLLKEAKQTCAADIGRFCKGIQPGGGRIAKCLKEHIEEVSPQCREKMHGMRKMIKKNAPEQ
jgi:hypothetical protein